MSLRLYVFGLISTIVISLALWLILIFNINPFSAPFWVISLFYITSFFFFAAIFSLIMFYVKIWAGNKEVIFSHIMPTLRQGSMISFVIVALLFFQQIGILNAWLAGIFTFAIILIELYFRANRVKVSSKR